jgi:hypothetical protein
MTMNTKSLDTLVVALEQYALSHYEQGGHWVYETYGRKDYLEAFERNGFDLDKAKGYIKRDWELAEMQCRECSSGEDWSGF